MPKPKKAKKALTDEENAERKLQKLIKSLLDMVYDIMIFFLPATPLDPESQTVVNFLSRSALSKFQVRHHGPSAGQSTS